MRRQLAGFAVLAVLCGCTGAPPGPRFGPVEPVGQLKDRVAARLRVLNPDRKAAEGGAVVLELQLVNVSRELATLYNELEPGWLVIIEVLGADGTYVRTPVPRTIKRGQGGRYHYAALPPGGFVGRRYRIRPIDPRWNLKPGRYQVRVVYANGFRFCVASPCFDDKKVERLGKDALVPLLTGMIASNVERFEVVGDSETGETGDR